MNIPLNPIKYEDEFELVAACKQQVAVAQNALYRRYSGPLMILCLRYIGNAEEAKEVLMDALVAAFRSIERFEYIGPGSLQAWLRRLTVNQCLMLLRKRKLQFTELGMQHEEQAADAGKDNIIAALSAKEMMHMVQALPPGYRTVFNLYVFEEMSHKEIAELLGISEGTAKSQLHKARLQLQKQMKQSQSVGL